MSTRIDFLPLEEIDLNPGRLVMIWLSKLLSTIEKPYKNQSGLIKISGVKQFQQEEHRLTRDLKSWITSSSGQSNEELDEALRQYRVKQKTFYDPEECLQYIRSHERNSILLILSPYHAGDGRILLDFERTPQIFKIWI